ncbi:neutral cholesterol ester hydrolase 1-like, partial [Elysia marginata]
VTWDVVAGQRVLIYRPRDVAEGEILPCLVYLHGGGWITDNPISYDHLIHRVALMARMMTISVHYRRAPQSPFPAAFDDCLDVTRHVLQHGTTLGIDVNRVGLAGDSAGGNLTAAVSLYLRQETNLQLPPLKYQILMQPVLQAMNLKLPSYIEVGKSNPITSTNSVAGVWVLYMGLGKTAVYMYA